MPPVHLQYILISDWLSLQYILISDWLSLTLCPEQRPDATLDDVGYIMGIKPEVMTEDADREGSLEDDLKNDFDTEELLEVQELSRNKLTDEEEQALGQLKQLADVEMAAKYSAPLKELALATRDSVSKKKKKNIVGVIIEVC